MDAASLIYRAFFSTPVTVKSPAGLQVNAAHGFLGMLARLIQDRNPERLCCAADHHWRPQWRVDLISSYKTHRLDLPPSPELDEQIPVLYEILRLARIPVAGCENYEAEDVIGALATRCPPVIEIVSGDRDLFQLVRDPDVRILYPRRGVSDLAIVNESYVADKYGIPGRAYGDYALLRGDTSDGLPGVPGIGEKTAAMLISKYGSLEAVIEAAMTGEGTGPLGKVRNSLDYLDRAAQVVLISPDIPVEEIDLTRPDGGPDHALMKVAEEYGLRNAVARLLEALRRGQPR